ncbi:MAG: HpcH/HpaI aldolase family protein [Alphaproteobacteria bacterium]
MPIVRNLTKAKLQAGEIALGVGLRQARTVDTAKIMKVCGYDWLFIDMEHNSMSMETAAQLCVAGIDAGITPIVRAPSHEHFHASRPLDAGAQGIVVPHVQTAAEAERVVSQCLYPPLGHRSVAGGMAQLEYESLPVADTTRLINAETLTVVMLESPEAIANADAMAAVPRVDVLLIGTNDLCAEMGIPGRFGDEQVAKAYDTVFAACRNNGKIPGMGGIYDQELSEKYIRLGMRFILAGNDLGFVMAGARARSGFLRGIKL